MRRFDIVGQRFGRLLVLAEESGKGALYRCRCECGKEHVAASHNLRDGKTQSCGCFRSESSRDRPRHKGPLAPLARPRDARSEYDTWSRMKSRCENTKSKDYPEYGGRGICVCAEWQHDFDAFLRHIGRKPSSIHSVDRIDNDRGYEPGNVRWATPTEQARNNRHNRPITIDGETKLLVDWARLGGNSASVIYYRLKRGRDPKDAVFAPTIKYRKRAV